ncbi:ArfGap-domain-containing protein [Suillus clintonianus]|uniref:ArfGap-domain-containing protein n=1 Tax=Suillus clintonianus TaxID=1904413 RepID=UPI001B883B73|nr:ArfGap-domain-containing protein [Suillus clintonianus]KAG2156310.1 ArfGap-domain-containing protein [Suillus clintonianus]
MDQVAAKRILQELIKREDLKNKTCVDCGNPNPQWASVSFAIFLCLQCAGVHRGFGVHISFVRSVSMDTWQADQIKRMQLAGNAPFRQFIESYSPADQGGYKQGTSPYDTYHCWAASQYREKLDAALADKPWSPSPPPPTSTSGSATNSPARPSSAQGLRKSRALARNLASPVSSANSSSPDLTTTDQKSANESFFASLGQANSTRPADLPPSQGGRYQGFGNTPSPSTSQHPSFGLSSNSAPTLQDFQDNPGAALSKGWSLVSAVVAGASRVVNENVIQPGMERALDPNLHATVRGYMSEAQRRAQDAGRSANEWSKTQLGVDVADQVGGVVGTVKDKLGSGPQGSGYGALSMHNEGETSALYHDDTEDFFGEYSDGRTDIGQSSVQPTSGMSKTPGSASKSKDDDWDEWKEF